jgi:hypothetical protein
LRQISGYGQQIQSLVENGDFEHGRRSADLFTWEGYLSIQSYLVDACVLRDYFAEFVALVLEQRRELVGVRITAMAALCKNYLRKPGAVGPFVEQLKAATAYGGWLHNLGQYRDLVVHAAPLASADRHLYALCQALDLSNGETLPSVKLPIPGDPGAISGKRSNGHFFSDPDMSFARFSYALDDPEGAIDGLQYAHLSFGRLVQLSSNLLVQSPVPPTMPVFKLGEDGSLELPNGTVFGSVPSQAPTRPSP